MINSRKNKSIGLRSSIIQLLPWGTREFHLLDKAEGQWLNTKGASNKVEDDEQTRLYQMDKFDFRTSNMFLVPMVALLIISISCFIGGIYRVLSVGDWDKMFIQLLLPAYIIVVNSPIIEGLVIRKDVGRIYPSTALVVTSNILATIITSTIYSLLRKV